MSKTWNDDTRALAWRIIHAQDKLTAALALALRGIARQHYKNTIVLLPTIRHDAALLEKKAQELISLNPRRARGGRPPKWLEVAENILYFSLKTQRQIDEIERRDLPGNYWKLTQTRLDNCLKSCRETQLQLFSCLPKEEQAIPSSIVDTVADLIDTLEMGQATGGGRWRRNR